MLGPEIAEFLGAASESYVAERVVAGDDRAVAESAANEQLAAMFPGGEPATGQCLYRVEEDGQPVGSLWIGPASPDQPTSRWVWDIAIDEPHRGRGLGRAAMLLAEREARATGAVELGLSVFGHNTVARHLYEDLGYRTVVIRMSKDL
jgi:ribosomal protein S18 acetylase RimI-like enzyme